jgi:hypothetical protein
MRGCASTSRAARVLSLCQEEVADRVVTWWHVGVPCAPSPTLIFIEHANGLLSRRLISTLIRSGSNIMRVFDPYGYDCFFENITKNMIYFSYIYDCYPFPVISLEKQFPQMCLHQLLHCFGVTNIAIILHSNKFYDSGIRFGGTFF